MSEEEVVLDVGSMVPSVRLLASTGGEVGLEQYRGQKAVALFFVREYR